MRKFLTATAFALALAAPAFGLTAAEKKMVAAADKDVARTEALLEKLVNVNSGTMNLPGVEQVSVMMREELEALGFTVRWVPMAKVGRAGHIVATRKGPAGFKGKRLLLIGHLDTVFEPSSPFQKMTRKGDIVEGPGVNDMKGGLVIMVQALRAMQAAAC